MAIAQPWVKKLQTRMPEGVTVFVVDNGLETPNWPELQLRERHASGSGFDPIVSPSLGMFRVPDDRRQDPLARFLAEWEITP